MSNAPSSGQSPAPRFQRSKRPPLLRRKERAGRKPWVNPWNWANILSSIRIIATIPLLMLLLNDTAVSYFWAFWFYAVVAITDLLDGQLARKYGWVSNLGIFLDLTADKIYTAGILICLVATNLLAPWAAIIILVREFVVTGLRSLAAAEGVVIPSGRWGKLKMIVTILALGWIMVRANIDRTGWFNAIDLGGGLTWLSHLSSIVLWLAVLLTIMSGIEYIWAAREIFRQPPRQNQD